MGKDDIFTSPLGIGLGIGLGAAVGAAVIGGIGLSLSKYMENDKSRNSFDSEPRSTSMFSLEDNDFTRSSSVSQKPPEHSYSDPLPIPEPDLTKHKVIKSNVGVKKNVGGKRSKKVKRKNKKITLKR